MEYYQIAKEQLKKTQENLRKEMKDEESKPYRVVEQHYIEGFFTALAKTNKRLAKALPEKKELENTDGQNLSVLSYAYSHVADTVTCIINESIEMHDAVTEHKDDSTACAWHKKMRNIFHLINPSPWFSFLRKKEGEKIDDLNNYVSFFCGFFDGTILAVNEISDFIEKDNTDYLSQGDDQLACVMLTQKISEIRNIISTQANEIQICLDHTECHLSKVKSNLKLL
jgi:hypothetical protein